MELDDNFFKALTNLAERVGIIERFILNRFYPDQGQTIFDEFIKNMDPEVLSVFRGEIKKEE